MPWGELMLGAIALLLAVMTISSLFQERTKDGSGTE